MAHHFASVWRPRPAFPVILFFLISPVFLWLPAAAQEVVLDERFANGNFTEDPPWVGSVERWIIDEFEGRNVLRLNAGEAGDAYLSTESITNYGEWEFLVYHDGLAPSNFNRAHVFLMADRPDTQPAAGSNGYAVRVGQNMPNRVFRIVRFENGEVAETIVSGETIIQEDTWYRVRVTRSDEGKWALFVAEGLENELQAEGEPAIDDELANAAWFSVWASYTGGNVQGFIFDEFRITKNPLFLAGVEPVGDQQLRVIFSEAVAPASVSPAQFELQQEGAVISGPESASAGGNIVTLDFATPLPDGSYTLFAEGVEDLAGSVLPPTEFSFEILGVPAAGDVLINEFFYDEPDNFPQYVELLNNSGKLLNLQHWRIQDNTSTTRRLTEDRFLIGPGELVVLTGNAAGLQQRFGEQNYLEMQNFPSLNRASPDQIKIFTDEELRIDSLTYSPAGWGGEGVALERRSPDAITHTPENWAESTAALGGTPGQPNTAEPDEGPVIFETLSYLDAQTLVVRFNRSVDPESAENIENYDLSGPIAVNQAQLIAADRVAVSLSLGMLSGNEYELNLEQVESIFGIPAVPQSRRVTYYQLAEPAPGDVVINEFMYDVAPGFSRYIELYNASDKAFDVKNWTSNNDTGNRRDIALSSVIFPPDSYLILAPDNSLFGLFPDTELNLINMGNRFSALKTSGDDIVIRDAGGGLLDSLSYQPAWGGSEVALERRSTTVPGFYPENWGDSPSPELGTPGRANEIPPDETAPELISAAAPTPDRIILLFSKSLHPETASTLENYTFSPAVELETITVNKQVISLFPTASLAAEQEYELEIQHLTDIFGNPAGDIAARFTYLEFGEPEAGDIIINELVYRVDEQTPRFVELYNRSARNLNLEGWQLGRSIESRRLSDPAGTIPLAAGQYLVVTDTPSLLDVFPGAVVEMSSIPGFSRFGDSVFLRSGAGLLVDSLAYEPEWGGNADGLSLERRDPESASNDASNWTSHPGGGHSAGARNEAFQPNETAPSLIFAHRNETGYIEARFNEFVRPEAETVFSLDGQALEVSSYDSLSADAITLKPASLKHENGQADELLRITHLKDVPGNRAERLEIPLAQPVQPGDVVINEIMFQPFNDSRNDFPDQSEYVELFNRRDYAVNLEGFFMHKVADRDGELSAIFPTGSTSAWLPARGYALLYADPEPAFEESRIAQFFGLSESAQYFRADRNTLSLGVQEDSIFLAAPDSTVIDSVFYRADWHNPNLPDTRGIALERINPFGESNEALNWGSNVMSEGGTPGAENSLFAVPAATPEHSGIVMEPNPFSPDGDGRDDNLFINYRLDEPDYLLRVRIFDRYGRLVRTLADGRAAGLEGSLSWDGRRDNGHENRMGIYIILFEAYNSSAGSKQSFRESVVLARQL